MLGRITQSDGSGMPSFAASTAAGWKIWLQMKAAIVAPTS